MKKTNFYYRVTTKIQLNFSLMVEMNVKIFGKNALKIMDFFVVRPYKICPEKRHEYYRVEVHFDTVEKHKSKLSNLFGKIMSSVKMFKGNSLI